MTKWPSWKEWIGAASLFLVPAVIFFGAWQAAPYFALALYAPVGLLLLGAIIFGSSSGDSRQIGKGCLIIFTYLSIGAAIGVTASHFLNTLKV